MTEAFEYVSSHLITANETISNQKKQIEAFVKKVVEFGRERAAKNTEIRVLKAENARLVTRIAELEGQENASG